MLDSINTRKSFAKDKQKSKLDGRTTFAENITNIIDITYFDNAKEWYANKFLYSYYQLLYIFIITACLMPVTYIIYNVLEAQSETKKIPFIIYFDDSVNNYPKIQDITAQYTGKTNLAVAQYLLKRYVTLRESYSKLLLKQDAWNWTLSQIKSMSSKRVFKDFLNYMNTMENPDSPILKYRLNSQRKIDIKEIKFFPENSLHPIFASVVFKSIVIEYDLKSFAKKNVYEEYFRANISFNMNDLTIVHKNALPMVFNVIKYNIEPIKNYTG